MRTLAKLADLTNQVALITGGAGHLGRVAAATLAELGCSICLLDLPTSTVESAAKYIARRYHVVTSFIKVDLEKSDARATVAEKLKAKHRRLDILLNNAAFVGDSSLDGWTVPFEKQSIETMQRCLEVNLISAFHLVQQCSGLLAAKQNGRIVNIGSIYGVLGPNMSIYRGTKLGNPAAYALSKGALIQLTRWLATNFGRNIRVNTISLGGILRRQPEHFVRRYKRKVPLGRMATEEDFKGAIAYFASDLSSYVTGQNLMVDGGWSVW
jgi:NAD(P)-dependent dehydrogenase (short-subunit alcohol dehydrogenase family)